MTVILQLRLIRKQTTVGHLHFAGRSRLDRPEWKCIPLLVLLFSPSSVVLSFYLVIYALTWTLWPLWLQSVSDVRSGCVDKVVDSSWIHGSIRHFTESKWDDSLHQCRIDLKLYRHPPSLVFGVERCQCHTATENVSLGLFNFMMLVKRCELVDSRW